MLPSRARSAVPRDIFCSAPPLGCGSGHVLDGSFARFCVSENVRVPLRYSGQPLHRKIIASRSPNTPWFCLSNRFFSNFNHAVLPSLFVGARSCNAPCLPVNKLSPKKDRAARMWTSRQSHCSLPFRQRIKPKNRPRNGQVSKPTRLNA